MSRLEKEQELREKEREEGKGEDEKGVERDKVKKGVMSWRFPPLPCTRVKSPSLTFHDSLIATPVLFRDDRLFAQLENKFSQDLI